MQIRRAPAHGLVALAWLSVRCGGVRVRSSFSPPSSPYSGKQGLLLNSFSIELTVQCDGCLMWGLGWLTGLVAGLRVGQAYGVFHRPGFGLLVSVPRSLSTQPPFATQALISTNIIMSSVLLTTFWNLNLKFYVLLMDIVFLTSFTI